MKIALVFYSFSGNTQKVNEHIKEALTKLGHEVILYRLHPKPETRNFFTQCLQAARKKILSLQDESFCNLVGFDYVVFSSPVWAFTITPALRSFLTRAEGLAHKKISCVLTHGGGGIQKAQRELEQILYAQSANILTICGVRGDKVRDQKYLDETLQGILCL